MATFVYAQTRTGEAQHAALVHEDGRASRTTECGRRVASTYGPAFTGEQGIQHPWRCDRCHNSIQKKAGR